MKSELLYYMSTGYVSCVIWTYLIESLWLCVGDEYMK